MLIQPSAPFGAGRVRQALRATFARRGAHPQPGRRSAPPGNWGPAYRKLALDVGLDPDVAVGYQRAAAFLDPILNTAHDEARWDPLQATW